MEKLFLLHAADEEMFLYIIAGSISPGLAVEGIFFHVLPQSDGANLLFPAKHFLGNDGGY